MSSFAGHPLRGQTVLLVGGSPADDHLSEVSVSNAEGLPDELSTRIEEAVISLARAVFARGGRLAFWHDPVITPIVADVALEYWVPPAAEGPSERSFDFARSGRSPVLVLGEPEDWEREWYEHSTRIGHLAFSAELAWPRLEPTRIVCVGGDQRVFGRLDPIRKGDVRQRPFVLPTTGGVTQSLIREMAEFVEDIESTLWLEIEEKRSQIFFSPPQDSDVFHGDDKVGPDAQEETLPQFRFALYPLLMSVILEGRQEIRQRLR